MISTFDVQQTKRKDLNVIIKMSQRYVLFSPILVWPDYGCDYKSSNEVNFWQNWDKFTPWSIGTGWNLWIWESGKKTTPLEIQGIITFSAWHKEASYPYATVKSFFLIACIKLNMISPGKSLLPKTQATLYSCLLWWWHQSQGMEKPYLSTRGSHSESPTALATLETGGHLKPAKKQNPWPKKPYADSTESL